VRFRLGPPIVSLSHGQFAAHSWTRYRRDTLVLLWRSDDKRVFVILGERGDSLSGRAEVFTGDGSDTVPPRPQAAAPVAGWRRACPPELASH
jgi:hypothetical protein